MTTAPDASLPAVLMVDDEENVLEGLRRLLRKQYDVVLCQTAGEALAELERRTFDVVVSDMRMPAMTGTELLRRVRARQPSAVRMILSGHADLEEASAAVNDVQVFRFLLKPASREALICAIDAGVEQARLLRAERELLEQTLTGCVDALSETLALVHPVAFGRSRRLRHLVAKLGAASGLSRTWALEMAAALSQLGVISLPPDTAERWFQGQPLSPPEQAMVERAAHVPGQLLKHVPRLEQVTTLLEALAGGAAGGFEATVLRVASALERAESEGVSVDDAVSMLQHDRSLDPALLAAARRIAELQHSGQGRRFVDVRALQTGMVLAADVKTTSGSLLITKGHPVSEALIVRLRNFARTIGLQEPIEVTFESEAASEAA